MKNSLPLRHRCAIALLAGLVTGGGATAQSVNTSETAAPRLAPDGLIFVERGDHKPPDIVSAAGRYILTVALYDRWTGQYVSTVEDARAAATHIDFAGVGLDIDDLDPAVIGEGSRAVTAFIDPAADEEVAMLRAARQNLELRKKYRIDVVFVPTRNGASINRVKQLACLPRDAGLAALLDGTLAQMPKARSKCAGFVALQKRVATATLIGVTGTPYIVAPDTRIHVGHPDSLMAWLDAGHDDVFRLLAPFSGRAPATNP